MPPKFIPLNLGLNTARAKVMLEEGELSEAEDIYYKPGDPSPWATLGRAAYNSTPEDNPIKGVRYLEFEGATDLIVAHEGTTYQQTPAATSGSFTDLVTGLTGGSTLDSVHYNNQHFLLNGVDRNRVVSSDSTTIFHGMLANTQAPTIFRDSGAGTGFTLGAGVTRTYWIEERVKSGSTILKRNISSSATCVVLTGDGSLDKPVVARPVDVVNSDATHWALYATAENGSFPNGAEITEVAIATLSVEDTSTTTGLPTGSAYEVVTIEVLGVTQNFPKNGPSTIASTGDIFEDSIVINDVSDPSHVVYSMQDLPHAFPAINLIRFETKEADEVKCIKRLGENLLVLMRDSVWRISTLPRPDDSAFETERVKAQVQGALGCVGPMAADSYSSGRGQQLAYVSRYGIVSTDGFAWETLTDDLDWESMVEVSRLSTSVLTYDPRHYVLTFDYTPAGETSNSKTLFLHVHPSHIKPNGKPKITGPINCAARCRCIANISGVDEVFTGNSDGKLYREWTGFTDASGAGGIAPSFSTGDLYLAGIGSQVEIRRFWLHHRAAANVTAQISLLQHHSGFTNSPFENTISLEQDEPTAFYEEARPEGIRIGVSVTNPPVPVSFNMIVVDVRESVDTRL